MDFHSIVGRLRKRFYYPGMVPIHYMYICHYYIYTYLYITIGETMGDIDAMANDARSLGGKVVSFLVGLAAIGTGLYIGTSSTITDTIDSFLSAVGLGGNALLNDAIIILGGGLVVFFLMSLARGLKSTILRMIFMFLALASGTAVIVKIIQIVMGLVGFGGGAEG